MLTLYNNHKGDASTVREFFGGKFSSILKEEHVANSYALLDVLCVSLLDMI